MTESGNSGAVPASPRQGVEPWALVDALRARSAGRCDPVGLRFIEALARRATTHGFEAGGVLERSLASAAAAYGERLDRAEREARDALARGTARFPEAADALRRHCDAGDFGALHRLLATLEARGGGGPLSELLAHIGRRTSEGATGTPADGAGDAPQGELRSLRYFRSTWSRLSVDRQLSHAFAQAPENAGPLNSHFLVLQSLRLMRDVAPGYLEQFLSYADALLWLDQADGGQGPARRTAVRGERDKKRKPGRGNAG